MLAVRGDRWGERLSRTTRLLVCVRWKPPVTCEYSGLASLFEMRHAPRAWWPILKLPSDGQMPARFPRLGCYVSVSTFYLVLAGPGVPNSSSRGARTPGRECELASEGCGCARCLDRVFTARMSAR
jgi:hypothetical protein